MDVGLWLGIPGGVVALFELARRGRRRYKRARRRLDLFFGRLEDAGNNARSIEALAGSVTQLVVVILRRLDQLEERDAELENRQDDLGEVLVDVEAELARHRREKHPED